MRKVLKKTIECQVNPDRFLRTWLLPHRKPGEQCPCCVLRNAMGGDQSVGPNLLFVPEMPAAFRLNVKQPADEMER